MLRAFLHLSAGDLARVLCLPVTFGFVVLCGWVCNLLAERKGGPPKHVHTIDYERSEIAPQDDGTILAVCCVAGCGAIVRIGRVGSGTTVESLLREEQER
jgi:hypothetical protein